MVAEGWDRERPKRRDHIRIDRYGWLDMIRDHRLSATEQVALTHLVHLANHRSWTYVGTVGDFAGQTRMSHTTVRKAILSLEGKGLIRVVEQFRGNGCGTVEVVCYDQVVVGAVPPGGEPFEQPASGQIYPNEGSGNRTGSGQQVDSNRIASGQIYPIDLGKRGGRKEVGQQGGKVVTRESRDAGVSADSEDQLVRTIELSDDEAVAVLAEHGLSDDPGADEMREWNEQFSRARPAALGAFIGRNRQQR